MTVTADPSARLVPAADEPAEGPRRRRFAALLALAFLLHVLLLAILLYQSANDGAAPTVAEEIPVEVVAELPPEPEVRPEPPPPLPPKREQPKPKMLQEDMKPAFDAPRDANTETVEREAPDKETQAQRAAPPTQQTAATPSPEKSKVEEKAPDPSPRHAPEKVAEEKLDEKPDAEAVAKAETKDPAKSKDRQQAKKDPVKTPASPGKKGSVADQLAALAPTPNYSVGSRAKPAPVAGGTENTTYLSILYGLIMRQWRDPPGSARALAAEGIVVFYVDETGNLTHQALYRASGRPDLDAAASAAVRRAAPSFPAPPRGMPRAIAFHYGTK
jgi:protein TonB